MRYGMIMAGGAGTRLWPMSREARPKQLLPFIGGQSLLELAAGRLEGVVSPENRLICTAERFRGAIREALPAFDDEQLLGEPVGRNTVNAVALTAAVLARHDPDAVFLVLTADHVIEPQAEFARAANLGLSLVEDDPRRLVTFAITPTRPAEEYGYVEVGAEIPGFAGARFATHFHEKPGAVEAQRYLDAGNFGWNSGMFVFAARTVLEALDRFCPESADGARRIADAWDGPDRVSELERIYPDLPSLPVDTALMEPAAADEHLQVCAIPISIEWKDVGSWPSYGETIEADGDDNRTNAHLIAHDSKGVLAVSDDPRHTIAVIGAEDLVVVRTADVTLVCPASRAQDVKALVERAGEPLR